MVDMIFSRKDDEESVAINVRKCIKVVLHFPLKLKIFGPFLYLVVAVDASAVVSFSEALSVRL